jgi:putative SOS response-associated peptidase YedK
MCGRYAFAFKETGRFTRVMVDVLEGVEDNYNISPTSIVPVYLRDGWKMMRWGLVPAWSKEPKLKYATFNARSDSLMQKPTFRSAWKHGQRCLFPATGYYEWKKQGSMKTPYFIKSVNDEPLVFAGLWDRWQSPKTELFSCTIITCDSDGVLKEIHDRRPLMLEPDLADGWIQGDVDAALEILEGSAMPEVVFYPVSQLVGNPRNHGVELIRPVGEDAS